MCGNYLHKLDRKRLEQIEINNIINRFKKESKYLGSHKATELEYKYMCKESENWCRHVRNK